MCENVLSVTTLTKGTHYIDSCNNITDFEWFDKKATIIYTPNNCRFSSSTLQVGLNSNELLTEKQLEDIKKQRDKAQEEARRQREEAKRQRDEALKEAKRQREEARRQRDKAQEEARRQRDEAKRQRDEALEEARRQREQALSEARRQREKALSEARRQIEEARRKWN